MSKPEIGPELAVGNVIARRVSCRAYQTTPVPEPHLELILEAARLSPSACNMQPWRFAVVRNAGLRRRIVEDGFLPGIKMTWAIDAPVHVVIGMERSLVMTKQLQDANDMDKLWPVEDLLDALGLIVVRACPKGGWCPNTLFLTAFTQLCSPIPTGRQQNRRL